MTKKIFVLLPIVAALAACQTVSRQDQMNAVAVQQTRADLLDKQIQDATGKPRQISEHVSGMFLGNKIVANTYNKDLPPVFGKPMENPMGLNRGDKVNLSDLAKLLTLQTKIPTEINPDVYLRSATIPNGGQNGNTNGTAAPAQNSTSANLAYDLEKSITLNYSGPLARFLDMVCVQLGISWEYADGHIRFFRYAVETIQVDPPASDDTIDSKFSSTGNTGSSSSSSTSSTANSTSSTIEVSQKSEVKQNFWGSLIANLNIVKSPAGEVSPNTMASTITVKDRPENIRAMKKLIADLNRRVGRKVYFKVSILQYTANDGTQFALDLAAVFTTASGKRWMLTSPTSVVSSAAGSIGSAILGPQPASGTTVSVPSKSGPGYIGDGYTGSQGTQAWIDALVSTGKFVDAYDNTLYTSNNQPVSDNNTTTQWFFDSTGTSVSNNTTNTTATQTSITTGTVVRLLPKVLDNGQIVLDSVFDISSAPTFEHTTIQGTTFASPTYGRINKRFVNILQPGQATVINATSIVHLSKSANVAAGGSFADVASKANMLIVITPILAPLDSI